MNLAHVVAERNTRNAAVHKTCLCLNRKGAHLKFKKQVLHAGERMQSFLHTLSLNL
jgi:hypothetical protein